MKLFFILSMLAFNFLHAQQAPDLSAELDAVFRSHFKDDEPGGAVLVVKEGKIIYQKGYGIADLQTQEKVTSKTLFNIGSISKTFVAYGILLLAREGKLSLDDSLYKFFPDFRNEEISRKVKIIHLLTHTSGLPDNRRVAEEKEFYLTAKDEENWAPLKRTDTLQFVPGTRYRYSNPSFNGLALIIEQITGQAWQSYIQDHIFKIAGMSTSTITNGPHPEQGVSHAYVKDDSTGDFKELDYGEEPTFAAAGNGGVWSSVEELWKYEQAIQQHLFLDKAWIEKSRAIYPFPKWKDAVSSKLGLSWFMINDMNLPMTGHTGSQGGFISDYCWWPSKKIFYVLLCNVPAPIKDIRKEVMDILLK